MTPIVRMNKARHPDLIEKARVHALSETPTHIRLKAGHWKKISGDKRPIQKSRGLGDTIAKVTKAVGVKPCGGCKKRQEKLNKILPYKKD